MYEYCYHCADKYAHPVGRLYAIQKMRTCLFANCPANRIV